MPENQLITLKIDNQASILTFLHTLHLSIIKLLRKGVSLYRKFSANKLRNYNKIYEYYHFALLSSFVLPYGGSQYTSVEIFLPN